MNFGTKNYWELKRIFTDCWDKDCVIDFLLDNISEENAKDLIKQNEVKE